MQHKNNEFKQTSALLIVVCLCQLMGRHGGNCSLDRRCRELPKGLIGGVGPLQCRRGNQLTKSRAKARQNCARGLWGRNRRRGSLCWGCRELPEAVATRSGPPWWEESTNTSDSSGEGAAVMARNAMTAAVVSGGQSAWWLRRSGLPKVRHHGRVRLCEKWWREWWEER
jgi:hypothetical protein